MGKKLRVVIILVVIAAVAGAVYLFFSRPVKINVITIAKTDLRKRFDEEGTAVFTYDYNIMSNVTGKVLQVFVSEGEYIEKGTIIAQIDTANYLSQIEIHKHTIDSYEAQIAEIITNDANAKDTYSASIEQLKQKLIQVKSQTKLNDINSISILMVEQQQSILELTIEQGQIELDYAEDIHEKNRIMYAEGIISKSEFDLSEQNYLMLKNNMEQLLQRKTSFDYEIDRIYSMYNENKLSDLRDAALNELNQATINEITKQISALETDMQKDYTTNTINSIRSLIAIEEQTIEQLERDVADCTIKTDVSGFVSVLPIMHTTLVSYQFMACTIMVEQDMVVESYVSTDDIVYVSIGDTVELVHEARDGDITYEGTITDIESWAGEQISKSGARSNKVKIVIQPSEEMKTVKNGYKLNVSYTISKADDELILPDSVFYSKNNADYVFIVDRQDGKNNGVLRAVPVKKGMSVNSRTVVLEGVAEGDIIVKDASENNLAEGISVSW